MSPNIRFTCPFCQTALHVAAGQGPGKVTCPRCKRPFQVPATPTAPGASGLFTLPARPLARGRLLAIVAGALVVIGLLVGGILLLFSSNNDKTLPGDQANKGKNTKTNGGDAENEPPPEDKPSRPEPPPEPPPVWTGHTGPVFALALTPRGDRAISGSGPPENTVRLWDTRTGKPVKKCLEEFKDSIRAVAIAPDGRYALIGCSGHWEGQDYIPGTDFTLRIWDLETDREVTSKLVLPEDRGKKIPRLEGHTNEVSCLAYSADGKRAASGGADLTVRVWDVATGKQLHCLRGHTNSVFGVAFSPKGDRILSCGADTTVRLWDVEGGTEVHCFRGHTDTVWTVAFSPDGRWGLSGSGMQFDRSKGPNGLYVPGTKDFTVRLWDLEAKTEVHRFTGHANAVASVAFTPDGKRIVSGSFDRTVRVWDVAGGKQLASFSGHTNGVYKVAVFPDGRHALSGSEDKTLRFWKLPGIPEELPKLP